MILPGVTCLNVILYFFPWIIAIIRLQSFFVLFCFTLKCWDGLQKVWSLNEMQSSSTEQAKNIAESERYIFRVFCYRAEAVSSFHLNCTSRKVYENKLLKVAFNFLFFAFSGFLKIQETLPLQ